MARRHHRTVVRRVHPVHTPLWRIAAVLLPLLAIFAAYYGGYYRATTAAEPYDDTADRLHTRIVALETRLEVETGAVDALRSELADNRAVLDELERELAFYRNVIAPEEPTDGVRLRAPRLYPGLVPGQWRYELVVQQGGTTSRSGRTVYKGDLFVTLWGLQAGQPTSHTLAELDDNLETQGLTLRFRYFQRSEGELTLPPGFEPETIELRAVLQTPGQQSREKRYAWVDVTAAPDSGATRP